ncbi:restin homolog isoform X1 [Plutella xylostella]|uniref:restin homolog isoform X1 n=2 Tax=Plutella xylostella TaxID=51655 RepID=UPI00203250AB|nr:restin homolog isoform X1 [Plutella xylostella]XP_048479589.1 restin homolog isoform X1 [Plutella xylostella]
MSEPQEEIVGSSTTPPVENAPPEANGAASAAFKPPESAPQRPTSLPKPSGLKPPSKIGRLCSNSAPKPAVPASPRTDGSTSDSVRKLSDDLSRKHLSDLIEDEEDEVSSSLPERPRSRRKVSTSSTFSGTSMDALWEKHPRRLSEAGLRRSSDHSVVLTEDTDSFIIGERVWVGGTKPGQIAYIGETQFAPGDWAGIVLDEPIGKNDGSVAGHRYFQCSEKRGVFSRLTRLTRVPLVSHSTRDDASPVSDAGSVFERPPSGMARARRALSPNGSIRSVVSSKMNASISTTTTSNEVRLGDRVIVSSSRGSKAGTLKYVGVTDFAPGVWAGVELDDPLGKNDGSVDGKRYFECSPRFGLFAPISKVSRSPSNRKPGQCAIHSNGRQTPIRRSNSRDSLTSMGTSIASSRIGVRLGTTPLGAQRMSGPRASSTPVNAKNALQELLREKQHHLERLMRERELERSEVAKVTLQADRAETALAQIKKEATQTSTENEKLKAELDKLIKQLEDERQKVEDLMFRNEEENINKEDYYKYKEEMEKERAAQDLRIRELEAEAVLQQARADAAAATLRALEDTRAAEAAAISEQHREELTAAQALSTELQKLLDEAYALLKEKESEKDSLGKSMTEELSKVKADSERALNEAKSKIAIAQTEFETQISVMTAKLQLAESKLESEKQNVERLNKENSQTIVDLNTKLAQLQAVVDDKTHELNKVLGSGKEHELNLNKEITKLKMELSAKVLDLEQLNDTHKKQEVTCKGLQEEIARVKEEYSTKINEYESLLNEASQQNEKTQSEIMALQQSLSAKTKDYERLLNESSTNTSSTEKLISEYQQTIHERDKEIIKLKDDYEQETANFNIKHSKIAEEHKKEIDDRNTKIAELVKEIESHKNALDQSKVAFETLNTQFNVNADELKSLKDENDQLNKSIAELTQANNELKAKVSAMELEIGEHKRQLESTVEKCNELQKSKEKIESEYMNLTGQATDSNEQFNQLTQHLKQTEKELQELKDKQRENANNHGRIEQELKQKLFKLQEDYAEERGQLVRSADDSMEKLHATENKVKEFEAQVNELKNLIKERESSNDKIMDENNNLKRVIEELKIKENEIASEYQSIRKQMETEIEKYKEEVSLLKAEGATSEVKLMEKVDQLIEAQNDLNNKLEESRQHEDALQKVVDDMTAKMNNQKSQYENEIAQIQSQLTAVSGETNNLKTEETRLKESLQEKENQVKDLTLKLEMLQVDVTSNVEIVAEKDRQITQINTELNATLENKKQLEEKLNNATMKISALKQQYESLIANSSAEESLVKEQLNQLECLRKDVAIITQDKTALESKCAEISESFTKLNVEHESTLKQLNENIHNNTELTKILQEKENLLKSQTDKNESDVSRIKALDEEIMLLKQVLATQNTTLEDKEMELKKLNEVLQSGASETQQKVKLLEDEIKQLSDKYKTETETLNKTCKTLQTEIVEKDKQLQELQQNKEKVIELQALIAKSESDIKQLTNINEGQKTNYEDLNKQLQQQFDEYKKESKKSRHDLKDRLREYEKQLQESKDNVTSEINKQNELQQKLVEADKNIVELTNKLELSTVQHSTNAQKDDQLEKLTLEMQALRKSSSEALANSEAALNKLKSEINNKISDLKQRDDMIAKLQEEVKKQKARVEIAEREKVLIQKEMASMPKDGVITDKNDNRAGGDDNSQKTCASETEGQVSFLNSVIVDMQRKNEQLLARVQALEAGPVTAEPALFNGRKPKAVAPRLFCDICDVFDAHDTEDCPRQAAAPDEPSRKPPPPPRPYCDICEVFGHSTENCDEEETF